MPQASPLLNTESPDDSVRRTQRRTVGVLSLAQAASSSGMALGTPVIALVAAQVTGSVTLAGVSQACGVVGGMLAAMPLAHLSVTRGRRAGIAAGYLSGALGALVIVTGGVLESYALLLLGPALLGVAVAAGLQARFGAADLAAPESRGRAIGTVVWVAALGGVLGPLMLGPLDNMFRDVGLRNFTGPYVGVIASLVIAAAATFTLLRPDPLLLARALRGGAAAPAQPSLATRLALLFRNPSARNSVLVVAAAHAVMLATMNMGALHLEHGGGSVRAIGVVMSGHAAGMFFFSPVMGWLADRIGASRVASVGLGVLLIGLLVLQGPSGHAATGVGVGLFLIGLGWSAAFVAGSALVTASVAAAERPGAQGAFDMLMQAAGALGALFAGTIVAVWGYAGLARLAALPVLLAAGALLWANRSARTGAADVPGKLGL